MQYESKLTNNEIQRYSRQVILPDIKPDGQIILRDSKILIVGLGGLGSPVLMYLASAGIGTIGILDYDELELHNLQRQIIYKEKDLKMKKSNLAYQFGKGLNGSIKLVEHSEILSQDNVKNIIQDYDLVVDCTDNVDTRYILNDACKLESKRFLAASVLKWEGQIYIFKADEHCYRCLFPEGKENAMNCDEAGVVGPVCGVIGSYLAVECIKCILNLSKPSLIIINALTNEHNKFDISNKARCSVCINKEPVERSMMKGKIPPRIERVDPKYKITWKNYFDDAEKYILVDIRNEIDWDLCHIKNSVNHPAKQVEDEPEILSKYNKKIALVCNKGISAGRVANILIKRGVDCYVIDGGLKKFKSDIDSTYPL